MPVLRHPSQARRTLGSPVISVNQSQRYLRQRVIAQRERRTRQDRKWRRRVWIGGICVALYVLIGRDLIGMTLGMGRAASSGLRNDVHNVTVALKKAQEMRERDRDLFSPSPVEFDSPATEEGKEDATDPTTWESMSPPPSRTAEAGY